MIAYTPDILDVLVGTPLGTSDHCFVLCYVFFRLSNRYRSTMSEVPVLLKHRTNWDNVRCAVSCFTWNTILKSADPLDAFDRAIGEVIGRLFPTTVLHSRSGEKQLFDGSCRRAYDAKQTAYRAWCRARSADH